MSVHTAPDGTLVISGVNFALNWSDDTPEYIEIEETSAADPEYWNRGYISVEALREMVAQIDEAMGEA